MRAAAVLERRNGEKLTASTVNVSGSGVLLELEKQSEVQLGESVICGVNLYQKKAFQSWGSGRVVRIDKLLVAVDFQSNDAAPGETCGTASEASPAHL